MRSLRRSRVAAVAVASAIVLTACGQSGSGDGAAAGPSELPDGWTYVAGEDVPSASDTDEQVLPVEVTGDDDVISEVTDTTRTIAGGDDIIEVFDALGRSDDIFAAPEESATETGRNAPQTFLFNQTTGTEGVLSLDGTLFLGNSVRRHTELAAQLRQAGLNAVVIDNLQAPAQKVRRIAEAAGYAAAGAQLAARVDEQLAEATEIGNTVDDVRVLHISATGAGGDPAVAGEDTAAHTVITAAGAINVGAEANVEDYSPISEEGIVDTAPDVILLSQADLETWGGVEGIRTAFPTLMQTPAGENNRFVVMPDLQLKIGGISAGTGAVALAEYLRGL
ncbi:ABC transporter substrate-binding protein [Millisia brevis]|uniref:ABC transporter substrate-binding protein n=1 Tax=Millisia brevis TaxID=264148 RepID=UPI0008318F3C|nr:ABC transporter substrate-binding protein [Millisia brevis]